MTHPARFTPAVLDAMAEWIEYVGLPVHDPFAGTGERLGALCDRLGVTFTGTEIEPEFIVDSRVRPGNSTDLKTYPYRYCACIGACEPTGVCPNTGPGFMVVTSPVYPNGMTDHFKASDKSRRHTYRQGLAEITGVDRPLHEGNMGRYGNRYRRSSKSEERHFDIARQCIQHWPRWAIVNVKDVIARDYSVFVGNAWHRLLEEAGYSIVAPLFVETPGQRHGENGNLRAPGEHILIARKDS